MLAIQPVDGAPSSKLFRLNTFWIFTVLGMSLPYRIWFARHCDQLRVTVVKETYAEVVPKSTFMSGWFTSKTPAAPAAPGTNSSVFRQQMQSLLLYAKETKDNLPVEANVSLPTLSNTTKATTQDKPPVKFSEASEMQSPNAIQDIPPVKFSEASEMQSPNATKADQSTTKEDEAVQKDVFQRAANTEALETQEVEQWNSNSTRAETHGFKQEQTALDTRKSSDQAERPFPMLDTSLQNNANSVASSTNNISKEGKRGPNES